MLGNCFIKQWLCKAGFISLVVTIFSVTQYIDKYVCIEFLTVLHCQLKHIGYCFCVITIDMENGVSCNSCNVCTIGAGTSFYIVGGKSYLVVYNHMNCATCFVSGQSGHLYHFVHHSLRGNCGITMNDDGYNFVMIIVIFMFYARTSEPNSNRSYGF